MFDRDTYRRSARGKALIALQGARYHASPGSKRLSKAKAARENRTLREFLHQLKSVPCADCGGTFHPTCMDFDHRPGEVKLFGVASSTRSVSMDRLRREIAKCDIVCSNCHRSGPRLRCHSLFQVLSRGVVDRPDPQLTLPTCPQADSWRRK